MAFMYTYPGLLKPFAFPTPHIPLSSIFLPIHHSVPVHMPGLNPRMLSYNSSFPYTLFPASHAPMRWPMQDLIQTPFQNRTETDRIVSTHDIHLHVSHKHRHQKDQFRSHD